MGNDAHHIGRKRDIEGRVGEFERGRVHDVQAFHLREPLPLDPGSRRREASAR